MHRKNLLKVPPEDYILNPGYLKLELMLKGIRIEEGVFKNGILRRGFLPAEGVLGGLDLMLPEKTWVNCPYQGEDCKSSPYIFSERGGRFYITNGEKGVEVALIPQPEFYNKKTSTGTPFYRIGSLHGGYIAITPAIRCEFFKFHMECKYCSDVSEGDGGGLSLYSIDEVLETVEAADKEGKADIIYITMGFVSSPDGGIEALMPYIKAIKKNFHTLIAVEILPPAKDRWIDETYAVGVDSVIYNLEIFDPELFKEICPGRAELIGRERYLKALRYAATLFPNGTVASHLIVGLEPPESTIKGIEYLTDIGVIPILPIFRPLKGSKLKDFKVPGTEDIVPIYGYLYRTIKRKGLNMGWVRDISVVTTPFEERFFTEEKGRMGKFFGGIYNSKLRHKAAWGLSTLRRKLRVKEVDKEVGR